MRAAPALSLEFGTSTQARVTLGLLALAATLVAGVWAWQLATIGAGAIAVAVGLLAGALLAQVWRTPRRRLRWDGQIWWLASPASADARRGQLAVALDLGVWLLLRFERDAGPRPRRAWLALQKRDLAADWHALRCALYSPRPAADPPAAPSP